MKSGRRGFFASAFGLGAASALGVTEPSKAESLKRGGVYALSFDRHLSRVEHDSIAERCEELKSKTGCEFIILGKGVTLTELKK